MKEGQYDCWSCLDGEALDVGQECSDCGRRGKRQRVSRFWEKSARDRLSSIDFERRVRLARQTLDIPLDGWTTEDAQGRLSSVYLALGISYCWSLPVFQQRLLPLKEEQDRTNAFREMGGFAEVAAKLSYPHSGRADCIEWLLLAKLISARLASWLETDNAPDIFLYLVCPATSRPDSWKLKPYARGADPALVQLRRFMCALLPIPERFMTKQGLHDLFLASAKAAHDASPVSLERERVAFGATFPEWGAEYPKKHQVRMRRSAKRLQSEEWLEPLTVLVRHLGKDSPQEPGVP